MSTIVHILDRQTGGCRTAIVVRQVGPMLDLFIPPTPEEAVFQAMGTGPTTARVAENGGEFHEPDDPDFHVTPILINVTVPANGD